MQMAARAIPPQILIVDDDPLMAECVKAMLQLGGYRAEAVVSGKQALELLAREHFDMVLTDFAMPEMTGTGLAAEIRRVWPKQRIAMFTGYGDCEWTREATQLGVAIISKPFDGQELCRAVAQGIGTSGS